MIKLLDIIKEHELKILQEVTFKDILNKGKEKGAPIAREFHIKAKLDSFDFQTEELKWLTQDFGIQGSRRTHETIFQVNIRHNKDLWNSFKNNLPKLINNPNAIRSLVIGGNGQGWINNSVKGHTNYYCSCESYVYGGFNFIATKNRSTLTDEKGNSLADKLESRAPVKTNPKMRGACCKHGLAIAIHINQYLEPIVQLINKELIKLQRQGKLDTLKNANSTQNNQTNNVNQNGQNNNDNATQKFFKKKLKHHGKNKESNKGWQTLTVNLDDLNVKDWEKDLLQDIDDEDLGADKNKSKEKPKHIPKEDRKYIN